LKLFKDRKKDVTIVKATDADISVCADLILKAMGGQPVNKEVLEQTLKTPNMLVMVAKKDDEVVGIITGLAFPTMIPPPRIDFLGVIDEESARRGLHGSLIDKFMEELINRLPNAKHITTNVPASNYQSVAIYSLKQFIVTGYIKGDQSAGDIVVLKKNLSKESIPDYAV